jgi:tripartite-type tricarboxylate transporter receptor subunit TctC
MYTRRQFVRTVSKVSAAAAIAPGYSEAESAKLARIVVGFAAGGGADIVARLMADNLRDVFPSGVVVDNRIGAGGRLAIDYVKAADHDGNTLLVSPDSPLTVYPHSYPKLSYDPIKDLMPVAILGEGNLALAVGPAVPASVRTVEDYLRWCREKPENATYGTSGAGSSYHFAGLMLAKARGVDFVHVPYRGSGPSVQDTAAGQIPATVASVLDCLQFYRASKLRILATFGRKRDAFVPEVPTVLESGIRGVTARVWLGVFAPKGTPEARIEQLNAAFNKVGLLPNMAPKMEAIAFAQLRLTAKESANMLAEDLATWGPVVKASGFKATD